jgi:biotin operon repressor
MALQDDDFQKLLQQAQLENEQSIVNLLTTWDKTNPQPKPQPQTENDILDSRKLCGDKSTLNGEECVKLLKNCLMTDNKECLEEFNSLDFSKKIDVDTMDYYVARNLAKHLGFYEDSVDNAIKKLKENSNVTEIQPNVRLVFDAIKEKINKVEKIDNKFNIVINTAKIHDMPKRIPSVFIGSMHGGGLTSYNDLIMNLDALKTNLLMNGGGSNSSILIKSSLKQLILLLEKEGKKIDDNDLARIYNYISSLERTEHKLTKVREYINVLIKAIIEKGYDIKQDKNALPKVTLDFLQKFAEKESQLINISEQRIANLQGTLRIVLDASGLKIT